MQELINALKIVDEAQDLLNKKIYDNKWWLTNGFPDDADIRVQKVVELASKYLTTELNECNWDNINTLENLGYKIYAGQEDTSGWLSGCIETTNGVIVYG